MAFLVRYARARHPHWRNFAKVGTGRPLLFPPAPVEGAGGVLGGIATGGRIIKD